MSDPGRQLSLALVAICNGTRHETRFGGRIWKLCFQITSVRQCEGLFSPFKYVLQSSVYRTELEASSKPLELRARFEFGAIDRRL